MGFGQSTQQSVARGHLRGYGSRPDTIYYWKVRVWDKQGKASAWSETATFQTGLLHSSDWHAKWIAAAADGPRLPQALGNDDTRIASVLPLPIFRDSFVVTKLLTRATLFVSGLGESEAFVNGMPVSQAVLTPGWTNYRKTVLYDAYNITSLLHTGTNVIGMMVGNGMYNVQGVAGRYTKFIGSFGQPKLIAQLMLHYSDGSIETVTSGDTWKTTPGPILFSSIYGGEDDDGRRLLANWATSAFRDIGWKPVVLVDGPGGQLRAERAPPVKITHIFMPEKVSRYGKNVYIYDLGQNFSGRPSITVHGPRGARISILLGELLDASGRVTQASAAASRETPVLFTYVLRGEGKEQWTPQFSYYGFRYAEVTLSSDTGLPTIDAFAGEALHDEVAIDGTFVSSGELLNRTHRVSTRPCRIT